MASTIPSQERVVDPFASYNSNVVNRITEIVTQNREGMLTTSSIQVTSDSTSPNTTVIVAPGYAIKDDVLIKITEEHTVDFTDSDQWVTPPDITFAGGNCYLVLEYQYLKQRPAPQAHIKILQPNERNLINGNSTYLLLKVVKLDTSSPHNILALYDADPESGYETNARKYMRYYAGSEVNLPTFTQATDQSRIVYESARDKFFFGHSSEWRELTSGGVTIDVNTDTTGVAVGTICYVNSIGYTEPAISTSTETQADMVITALQSALGPGTGLLLGFKEDVPVETGITIAVGDLLYLSDTDAGTVTNIRPNMFFQVVGRALSAGNDSTPVDMIFAPKAMLSVSTLLGQISTWIDATTGYYYDIDVSNLGGSEAFDCHWFDDFTSKEIRPSDVEIRDSGDTIRVYFDVNTLTVNYMIQSVASTSSGTTVVLGGYVHTQDTTSTTWVITHSLNQKYVNVQVSDESDQVLIPDSITYDTANQLTVTFLTAKAGHAVISTGAGSYTGGGSGGVGDHSLLLNLDYASSGHTGFAPSPHNNTHHSETYITATGVTYSNLNTNGDVGTGAAQVAQGNHSHAAYIDVPAGAILLFESDTAISGYSLLTTDDDKLVYITKGSGAGGDAGGTDRTGSTWTQPTHSHTISGEADHNHSTSVAIADVSGVGFTTGTSYHNHGNTGNAGSHDHTGSTSSDSTASSWRPKGLNYTRQQRV